MSTSIIIATGNQGKVREFREVLSSFDCQVRSMKEADCASEPEENGTTFAENAMIKAKAVAAELKRQGRDGEAIILADDSGLVIDALNGEPGIYSARYLGHDTPYEYKNKVILEKLKDVPEEERTARFVCAIAAVYPDGTADTSEAVMEGHIAHETAGENGFGYDPIFYLPEYRKTSAELSPDEKNAISHRGKALRDMVEKIRVKIGK